MSPANKKQWKGNSQFETSQGTAMKKEILEIYNNEVDLYRDSLIAKLCLTSFLKLRLKHLKCSDICWHTGELLSLCSVTMLTHSVHQFY